MFPISKTVLILGTGLFLGVTLVLGITLRWDFSSILMVSLQGVLIALLLHIYRVVTGRLNASQLAEERGRVVTARQVQGLLHLYKEISPRKPLPPLGEYAATPELLATLASLVRNQRPKVIVELGSGSSTLVCAYVLQSLGDGRIYSFDHESDYGQQTRERLQEHGLQEFASVNIAPLRQVSVGNESRIWYDLNVENLPPIDLLIVDGPPYSTASLARYPALPRFWPRLAPGAVIVVDDANRPDERAMVARWLSEFPGLHAESIPHEKGTVIITRKSRPESALSA
jgi:predicted O-methyltransferase YrrM